MSSAVILTGPGFQDHDVVYTYYRLLEEGWTVDVATRDGEPVTGKYGVPLPMDKTASPNISFDDLDVAAYDAVICTGGHEAPDRVRQDRRVRSFVAGMAESGRVVAGLCHGPWIMVSAGVLRGRNACAYIGLRDDVVNAGAHVIDSDVVVDGNIITCSYYAYVGRFMRAVFETTAALAAQAVTADAGTAAAPVLAAG
ncbi:MULTISPECIES: DJ-1/PfpI family protein [Pseudofrankia]|uniref:DJ-1/PfpI family protein n=1 Tax=Pseudofrankia TaxID=2994363 RepID=UPI000234D93F|nr:MULTISPECIES: DJ-1/PfpI family protein [Pseudofrankia]OHV41920.1 peptidase C56 [Pseudofrankia sp. EUN1h]